MIGTGIKHIIKFGARFVGVEDETAEDAGKTTGHIVNAILHFSGWQRCSQCACQGFSELHDDTCACGHTWYEHHGMS